jgi:hypothetical protein
MNQRDLPMNREDVRNVERQRRNKTAEEEIMEDLNVKCILRYVPLAEPLLKFLFSRLATNQFIAVTVINRAVNTKS